MLADDRVEAMIDNLFDELPALGASSSRLTPVLVEPQLTPSDNSDSLVSAALETEPAARPQELLERLSQQTSGSLSGSHYDRDFNRLAHEPGSLVDELISPAGRKALSRVEKPEPTVSQNSYGLSGPVAQSRQVLSRPEMPKISLSKNVTVGFKFWVRPDGSVCRIKTKKIGDLEFVSVAERYLQQWRFSILSADLKQQDQWGTINIIFRVPR